ncbi:copper resistance protein NlpE N-terminal domain-containing protein [Salinicola avicenniae]|uniref:copper resistance protein NlpE N-terminal domain-containing protein n=1 Tax=Salinicola avicenniae TaxID=2916836 RepID=UPI0020738290|nr:MULTISPECIES: copper resistance protein NlpE N-terminal domain-containing protein [unclassified Salinicola]
MKRLGQWLAGGSLALVLLAGCSSTPPSSYEKVAGEYKGVLPCADCSGINIDLEMVNMDDTGGAYVLRSVYQGRSDEVMVTRGNFLIREDAGPQQLPIVYDLKGAGGNTIYYLRPMDNGNLEVLDTGMQSIQSGVDVTLKRQ